MNKIEGNVLILVVCHLSENNVVAFYDILNPFIGNQLKYLKVFENYYFYLKRCTLVTESMHQNNVKIVIRAIRGMKQSKIIL